MAARAYPLQWPDGWGRTPSAARRRSPYKVLPEKAIRELVRSLELLGARTGSIVISTNVPQRRDGLPYMDHKRPDDPGVAVFWTMMQVDDHKMASAVDRVMACDRWLEMHENVRAIGLAVDGLRSIERAGASQILNRAFSAFGALPAAAAPRSRPWWEVLEIPEAAIGALSVAMIDARYRELTPKAHPDKGGSDAAMAELTAARDQARATWQRVETPGKP